VPGLGLCSTCNCRGAAEVEGAAMNLRNCTGEEFVVNTAVKRGDLWTLNYTKMTKSVSAVATPGIAWEAHDAPQTH